MLHHFSCRKAAKFIDSAAPLAAGTIVRCGFAHLKNTKNRDIFIPTNRNLKGKGGHMANIITGCRILCSILLLFVPAFSPVFYILYLVAGFTDMIDGAIARKTNTANEFGAVLDTLADIAFVVVCMIKLLPVLIIPTWLYIWIGVIAIIKVFSIISEYIVKKKFAAKHTLMNKITGVVLFVFPLTLSFVDLKYSGGFICTIATLAAIQEAFV